MERTGNFSLNKIEYLIYLIYAVGIIGHLIPATLPWMLALTPYTLFLTGIISILSDGKSKMFHFGWSSIFLFTLLLEIIGVNTGLVFGSYKYSDVLGLSIFDTPLVIGLNWTILMLGGIGLSNKFKLYGFWKYVLPSIILVLFDYIMEPVAIKLNYWTWQNNNIPLQNYLAWFFISFYSIHIWDKLEIKSENKIAIKILITEFVFFIVLRFFLV